MTYYKSRLSNPQLGSKKDQDRFQKELRIFTSNFPHNERIPLSRHYKQKDYTQGYYAYREVTELSYDSPSMSESTKALEFCPLKRDVNTSTNLSSFEYSIAPKQLRQDLIFNIDSMVAGSLKCTN